MHHVMSFNQVFWPVENDWYIRAPDMTLLESLPLDTFRAMARTKSTTLVTKPWFSRRPPASTPENENKVLRSINGTLMAHDIPVELYRKYPRSVRDLKNKLNYFVEFSNTRYCLFSGYWKTSDRVRPSTEAVHASIYSNTGRATAVIIFLNAGMKDHDLEGTTFDVKKVFWVPERFRWEKVKRVFDFETDQPIQCTYEGGRYRIAESLKVPWHEYRILAIEAE